ncbi:MAG: hypothetical protein H0T89_17740 [Deltaproteobacteria bacterium]|nr:hypothetical protein [Deltaproteobacteria bacterium]MDQ3300080.1 hypothetical protein [Myxococcota bacterium]
MKTHVILDLQTGQLYTIGRDGTRYTAADVRRAQFRAKRGDEAARAIVANIDRTDELADTDPALQRADTRRGRCARSDVEW